MTNMVTVSGTLTGLQGTGLVLQNNGGDNLAPTADGTFTFTTSIASGTSYSVTVLTQPAGPTQYCSAGNGSGTATGNVTNIAVICQNQVFAIGGTFAGLKGSIALQYNGGNNLRCDRAGAFQFGQGLASGATYTVTILSQPSGQTCTVANATGVIGDGPRSPMSPSAARPPSFPTQPTGRTVVAGETATFNVVASGEPALHQSAGHRHAEPPQRTRAGDAVPGYATSSRHFSCPTFWPTSM